MAERSQGMKSKIEQAVTIYNEGIRCWESEGYASLRQYCLYRFTTELAMKAGNASVHYQEAKRRHGVQAHDQNLERLRAGSPTTDTEAGFHGEVKDLIKSLKAITGATSVQLSF